MGEGGKGNMKMSMMQAAQQERKMEHAEVV